MKKIAEADEAITRREFLLQSCAGGVALASAAGQLGSGKLERSDSQIADEADSDQLSLLRRRFLSPELSTAPMTRWWWFGGAVTREEITRELTLMREAGLRGVELQPVYPIAADDPQRGIRNIRYFSPEWFDLLRHTVQETRRLGLQFDSTLGSGWSYGGPFIPLELAARKLQVIVKDVVGPGELVWDLGTEFPDDTRFLATVATPILPLQQPDIAHSRVIPQGQWERWKVPAGAWRLMTFVDCPTLMQVKRPTVGMEGYILDHFRRESLDTFLDAVGNRTLEALKDIGQPPFHSVFCDSLEVEGADWTDNLLKEFSERRGYDLRPFLPALWQHAGALTPHIRYDYHLTLSELTIGNFFQPLAEWSKQHGMKSRIQAHGAMGDVMQGYALADIPEGEHIGPGGDQYRVDIAHRRLASSAGHIYQKPVISAETYTWLHAPLFTVTLEMMKAATDAQFLDGINQIVNHGYAYSPPEAGVPGWTFYASTVINHNNLWWRHYSQLAHYIRRTAGLLQQGVTVNQIGVYLPLPDLYAKFGAGGLHIDEAIEAHLGTELVTAVRRAGYDFDFLNDDALQKIAKVEDGRLLAGTAAYSAVLVPEARYMPVESFSRLAEFVRSGGLLMFIKDPPDEAPGLTDHESRTRVLRAAQQALWKDQILPAREFVASGKGTIYRASGITDAISKLQDAIIPDFTIVQSGDNSVSARNLAIENVGFLRRRVDSVDLFFLSNIWHHAQDLRIRFAVGRKVPQRWNPETGVVEETLIYEYVALPKSTASATEVQLRLDPFDACFVVFRPLQSNPLVTRSNWPGPLSIETVGGRLKVTGLVPQNRTYVLTDAHGNSHHFSVSNVPEPVVINSPWHVLFDDGIALSMSALKSWTDLPERTTFSGWATYETDFEVKEIGSDLEWVVDLGTVRETAEVALNGVNLGPVWKGLRQIRCRESIKQGTNHLKVDVANLWINKVESLPKRDLKLLAETYGIRWGTDEEKLKPPVPPSGLLGPVRLIALRRRTEQF